MAERKNATESYVTTATGLLIPKSIVDAKGDLIVASAADTVDRLAAGANGKALIAASGESVGVKWDFPPGYELNYVQRTSDVSSSASSAAAATAMLTGSPVTYDGLTTILIEVYASQWGGASGQSLLNLWEDSSDLGRIAQQQLTGVTTTLYVSRRLTPTAGERVYTIKGWTTSGTVTVYASGPNLPAFIRITKV